MQDITNTSYVQTGKIIIYQMLPRLWGNLVRNPEKSASVEKNGRGTFATIDKESLSYIKSLGATHVWYTGVIRHATRCGTLGCSPSSGAWVKGEAGSPYSITDYFDVNPYLATDPDRRMEEWRDLVRRTHEMGLKVIVDLVPNHVARDYGAFSPVPVKDGRDANNHPVFGALDDNGVHWKEENDFFYYPGEELRLPHVGEGSPYREYPAKASGNCYSPEPGQNDWFDTVKLNYCDFHTRTWEEMTDAALFWASTGVDGFRCDMVELVPQAFCAYLIRKVKESYPQIVFVAEVYQKHLYDKYIHEVGFDILYDKSGLYDALHDIMVKNAQASGMATESWQSASRITWNWQSLGSLQPYMLNFLENHDEQRLSSEFFVGDPNKALAGLYLSLYLNTAPFMLYFGQELGESGMDEEGMSGRDGRTSIFDWWSVGSLRRLYNHIHSVEACDDDLTPNEKALLEKYRGILTFATTSKAISQGQTYDLCYCNLSSNGFNKDKHFVFLRSFEQETLLVGVNFSDTPVDMEIVLPPHAFEWLKIPAGGGLTPFTPIPLHIEPFDGTVLKLRG